MTTWEDLLQPTAGEGEDRADEGVHRELRGLPGARPERLAEADAFGGVLLDGFPRNVIQAAWLDGYLAGRGTKLAGVVVLRVPDEELKSRLVGRAEKQNRSDDADPAVVQRRIDTYKEQSEPCIAYYEEQGMVEVHEIDGVGSIEEIEARIRASVGG